MKTIIFCLLLLLHVTVYGQNYFFNKLYSTDTSSILSMAGKPVAGGYLIVGGFNSYNGYSATYVRKIDLLGNEEWSKVLDGAVQYSAIVLGNTLIRAVDDNVNYMVVFTKGSDNVNRDITAIKFTPEGDTLWQRIYEKPNYTESNAQIIAASNGGYLIAGSTYYNVPDDSIGAARFYVIKTNAEGIKQWEAEYGLNCSLSFAHPTSDGGYILSGYRDYPPYNYDMYVVKIDSVGALQWDRNYGTPEDDGGCQVIEYAPNQYALFGLWNSLLPSNKKYFYYTRLDSLGNQVGTPATYEQNGIYSPEAVYMTPQRDFIVGMVTCCPSAPETCTLAKFNVLGERLWEVPIESGVYDNDYLRDIEPTPDGGYLLVGFNYTPMADSWVIKVDSLGNTCGIANCDSTSVIDALPQAPPPPLSQAGFSLAPNPATDVATLYLSQAALIAEGQRVELFDVSGRLVKTFALPNFAAVYTFSVADLPNGIYYCHLQHNDRVYGTQKLVIIR